MPTAESTHPSLLSGLKAKDAESWSALVDLYGPLIFTWCRRGKLPDDAAADVMQETFLAVSRSIDSFAYRGQGDRFRAWLYGITRNHIALYWRRRERILRGTGGSTAAKQLQQWPGGETSSLPDDESSVTTVDDRRRLVRRAIELIRGDVRADHWEAFRLTTLGGMSSVEAARELNLTPATVRQAKCRVARRLRQQLGEC